MYASLAPCIDRYGLVAVGATDAHDRPAVVCEKWSIETQTRVLAKARIGLFVQPEGPWESRKSGYKLLEYVANGVIPVAEDNMAAREILGEDYEFLVPSGAWADALDRACSLSDSEARECLAALTDHTERFSYSETVHRWVDFVEDGKPQKLRANTMRLL
ncbi:glycosyltransferase [Rhodococcus jostii]|uniref:glycosyltransferase n=1 Tax=Rhodococcus jostii TaxID=132919 RepID=UPI00363A5AE7